MIARGDTLTPRLLAALRFRSRYLVSLRRLLSSSAYRGIEQAPSSDPAPRRTLFRRDGAPSFPGEPPLLPSSRYPFGPLTPEPSGPCGGLLDKERPTIDGGAHPHIGVRVPIRRDFHGSRDTLRLNRHIETRSTFSDPDRNSHHRGSLPFLIYPLTPLRWLPEQAQDATQGGADSTQFERGLAFSFSLLGQ